MFDVDADHGQKCNSNVISLLQKADIAIGRAKTYASRGNIFEWKLIYNKLPDIKRFSVSGNLVKINTGK